MKKNPPIIAIIIPPKAQPLDVSGPLAAFREAYRQTGGEIRYDVRLISSQPSRNINLDGMTVAADYSIQEVDFEIDTLLIAGTHAYQQAFDLPLVTAWLRDNATKCRRYGSVCTGAFFLAEAGLLAGKKATTHWQQANELAERYPNANIFPDSIFVQDGPLCTSAGITAGIDLALKLIEDDHGRKLALSIARRLVVYLRRTGGQSQYSPHLATQTAEESRIQAIQQWIVDNIKADLSVPVLAAKAAMSVRNFSRVFREETGQTPANYVELIRVDAARRMLEDTQEPLQRIATYCGFSSTDLMRSVFLRRLKVTPKQYRRTFVISEAS